MDELNWYYQVALEEDCQRGTGRGEGRRTSSREQGRPGSREDLQKRKVEIREGRGRGSPVGNRGDQGGERERISSREQGRPGRGEGEDLQ